MSPSPDAWLCPRPRRFERLSTDSPRPARVVVLAPNAWVGELGGERFAPWVRLGDAADSASPPGAGEARVRVALDPTLAEEGYRLRLDQQWSVDARTPAGLRHALRTLRQWLDVHPVRVPGVAIEDEPAFPTRGFMLDVSRDRVPSMPQLLGLVETLASLKMNHLQLYTEHTFAYRAHERVWLGWSPMTHDEVRRLDAHARAHGIELAANQNCFGHLASWLRHPEYAHLAETHGEWTFLHWPRAGPFSLCPTDPRSIEFVRGLLAELAPCFSSPLVNIGCDETYDIEFGRSREEVHRRGRAAVYADFVDAIAREALSLGRRPMFWADIALTHPEILGRLPRELLCLAWGYEDESPFARWCRTIRDADREPWVCPGTSSWRSITGRTQERRANIDRAAREGLAQGARGLLLCDWGDTGHHQQWPLTLHALAHAAHAAWNPLADHHPAAGARHALHDQTGDWGDWLDRFGDADLELRQTCGELARPANGPGIGSRLRNQSALFLDMHTPVGARTDVGGPRDWELALRRLEALGSAMPQGSTSLVRDEIVHALDAAVFAGTRAFERRLPGGISTPRRRELRDWTERLARENARLWRVRARPGGLSHSQGFWRAIAEGLGGGAP